MALDLEILESNNQIEKMILAAIVKEIGPQFKSIANKIKQKIHPIIVKAIHQSPAMGSVRNGILKLDFGLTSDPTKAVAEAVADSLEVEYKPTKLTGSTLSGGILIKIQPFDYLNLISMPFGINVTEDGDSLPWIEWLALRGNQIIIADFGVKYQGGEGRTNGAIMTKSSAPFKVNSSFSGVATDNFITKALNSNIKEIQKAIEDLI